MLSVIWFAALASGLMRPQLAGLRIAQTRQCATDTEGPSEVATGAAVPQQQQQRRMFIFGLGYVGCALAKRLQEQGWQVAGTCTSLSKAKALRQQDIQAFLFDAGLGMGSGNAAEISAAVQSSTHILSTVPPAGSPGAPSSSDAILQVYGNDILKAALGAGTAAPTDASSLEWVGYLSSTGVYGDRGGGWVSEQDTPEPDRPKTLARLEAEKQWRALHLRSGLPVHVFRLAGIYGPGRSAADTVVRNEGDFWACQPDASTYISRIHVDDICTTLLCSALRPQPGLLVNVADDLPATRFDVLSYACRLLELPVIRTGGSAEVLSGRGGRGGSKKVDNALLRGLLQAAGVGSLRYPDYRSGLESIVHEMKSSGDLGLLGGAGAADGAEGESDVFAAIAKMERKIEALSSELAALKLRAGSPSSAVPSQRWRQEE